MTFFNLLLRNLFYHWRGNLAVFLGIALGSAVLTGALLVGDSLRGSLKALTLEQLGWVDEAMLPGRFFRDSLKVSAQRQSAILLLQGNAARVESDGDKDRVGRVSVLGVNASFWPATQLPEDAAFWSSSHRPAESDLRKPPVILNQALAKALAVKVGDEVALRMQKAGNAPGETILGQRKVESATERVVLRVHAILPDAGMARFSLRPTPEASRNAFVPIRVLQEKLDLAGRANVILAAGAAPSLQADLRNQLTLDDWGLRYRSPEDRAASFWKFLGARSADAKLKESKWRGHVPDPLARLAEAKDNILTFEMVAAYYKDRRNYHVLESQRMLLEPLAVNAVSQLSPAAPDGSKPLRWNWTPTLVYLADSISDGEQETPYSIIASNDDFVFRYGLFSRTKHFQIADDQILVPMWPGSPLKVNQGQSVHVRYMAPDARNHLKLSEPIAFRVHSTPQLDGVLDDPDLTPEFPGITDSPRMDQWTNPPFPYDKTRVKPIDEEYWKRYRTTPKAYINLKKAQQLWSTRFGDVTSIQVRSGTEPPETLPDALRQALKPEQGGFVFQPVRAQAIQASNGTVDFGEYFLYFSFFIIVAALLLVGLLVRLNIDRRAPEIGLLLAIGWSHAKVRWLVLVEGIFLAVVGAAVGLAGALCYADLMLRLLAARWPGDSSLVFLRLHADVTSFTIGYASSVLVSVATLWWSTRVLADQSPRSLLSGGISTGPGLADSRPTWSLWLIAVSLPGALALALLARWFPSQGAQTGAFFGSGALLLIACLSAVWVGLKRSNQSHTPQPSLWRLSVRNAGRNAVRSVLTAGLLASASFLIVAVESFHKAAELDFQLPTGGSGGMAFLAEGSAPIFEDLNQPEVRRDRDLNLPELAKARFYACRLQSGDDASCLNLYKPLKPRVMGLPTELIERGGFKFAASLPGDASNPWSLLNGDASDGIPAIVDANSAAHILKVGLGDTMTVNNAQGEPVKLRIVALLDGSIFQSEVLIAEKRFLELYPRHEGFSFILIDAGVTDPSTLATAQKQLVESLAKLGLDVQTTASRVEGYHAVENMYLSTFQALGGLGLVLGAVGLAIVLLRGVWERRAELALLAALGFRTGQLAWLVLVENAFLLGLGLASGTASALLAVAPHLTGAESHDLWLRIGQLLGIVAAVGLMSALLAVWSTLRTPVLTAIRRE